MKPMNLGIALACGLGLATAVQSAANSPHEDHVKHAATAPAPVPAQRWATDAPLREGMRRVHFFSAGFFILVIALPSARSHGGGAHQRPFLRQSRNALSQGAKSILCAASQLVSNSVSA